MALLRASLQWVLDVRERFLQLLVHSGWNVEHLFLEGDRQRRIHVLQGRGQRKDEHDARED